MTVTAAMIVRLRRMVQEPTDDTYDEAALTAIIDDYPMVDERGEQPYTWDTTTSPPTQDANDDWLATYDLHAAAVQVWEEKAATVAHEFGFSADGGQYHRNQKYEQALGMARHHNARRAVRTIRAYVWPKPTAANSVVGNLAEED